MKQFILGLISKLPNSHWLVIGGLTYPWDDTYSPYQSMITPIRFLLWLNALGASNQWIVSTYNAYEWIDTYNGHFKFVFTIWCKHQQVSHTIEKRIKGLDQITSWSAYDNFR